MPPNWAQSPRPQARTRDVSYHSLTQLDTEGGITLKAQGSHWMGALMTIELHGLNTRKQIHFAVCLF